MISKKQLIRMIRDETGYTLKDITIVLTALEEIFFDNLIKEEEIQLFKGLVFSILEKRSRLGVDPKTGKPMMIPARFTPKARFTRTALDKINKSVKSNRNAEE